MNWQSLNTIWKPDTFFVNGKKSKMHKITVPNKFLRISPDGRVSYSQRLTIHARCRMHLLKFPLDSQICPLWISSYGYASRYVYQYQFGCGILKTVGPKKQDFWPKIDILKGNHFENTGSASSSKTGHDFRK